MEKLEQNNNKATVFFSWLVAFSPWLSIYSTFYNGISFADLTLIIFMIYFLLVMIKYKKPIKISVKFPIILLIYLLLVTLVSYTTQVNVDTANVINRYIKYSFFWFIILFIFPYFLNKKELFRGFRVLTILSCVGILIQYFIYYFIGTYLELKIPFLNYVSAMETIDFSEIRVNDFRPSSIFIEPSHFVVIAILYLSILLFQRKDNDKFILFEAIFISICILLSTSSTAVVLLGFIWSLYTIKNLIKWKSYLTPIYLFLCVIVFLFIFVPFFINTEELYFAVERISNPENVAVTGRINAGDQLVQSLTGIEKWIGIGFGNFSSYVYVNSINYFLLGSGYIGIVLLGIMWLNAFFTTKLLGKVVLTIFLLLCFSSPIVISINIIPYASILYCLYKEEKFSI